MKVGIRSGLDGAPEFFCPKCGINLENLDIVTNLVTGASDVTLRGEHTCPPAIEVIEYHAKRAEQKIRAAKKAMEFWARLGR